MTTDPEPVIAEVVPVSTFFEKIWVAKHSEKDLNATLIDTHFMAAQDSYRRAIEDCRRNPIRFVLACLFGRIKPGRGEPPPCLPPEEGSRIASITRAASEMEMLRAELAAEKEMREQAEALAQDTRRMAETGMREMQELGQSHVDAVCAIARQAKDHAAEMMVERDTERAARIAAERDRDQVRAVDDEMVERASKAYLHSRDTGLGTPMVAALEAALAPHAPKDAGGRDT